MPQAIQALESGPIDVIGDIHGELDALNELLARLGYDQFGRHPEQRRLVFLGDLIDRGPDSPGVIEKVSGLYFARRAQCILGNHELRLINQINKPDNSWINAELAAKARRNGWEAPMRVAHTLQLRAALTFFSSLPIALVRSDVRLVHACWDPESVAQIPKTAGSWSALFARFRRNINAELKERGWNRKRIARLKSRQPLYVGPPEVEHVEFSEELSDYFIFEQNAHPLKVLTQGLYSQVKDQAPFWSGYRWQMSDRQQWWHNYQDDTPVIFGHYWRPRGESLEANLKPSLFEGVQAQDWLGPRQNCFCLDFAVGLRFQERLLGATELQGSLAAMRIPEEGSDSPWELIFDDGERHILENPTQRTHT